MSRHLINLLPIAIIDHHLIPFLGFGNIVKLYTLNRGNQVTIERCNSVLDKFIKKNALRIHRSN
jgi:hypothetical protein